MMLFLVCHSYFLLQSGDVVDPVACHYFRPRGPAGDGTRDGRDDPGYDRTDDRPKDATTE